MCLKHASEWAIWQGGTVMGGSKQSSNQQTKTEIPAEIRERGTKITSGAMNAYFDPSTKYEPYNYGKYKGVGQDTTAQLTPSHTQAGQNFSASSTSFQPYIDQAQSTATAAVNGHQAQMMDGPDYTWENVQRFMNPFTQGVIDQGVTEINRDLTNQRIENQSRAAQAGAFGGARHGVIDAESQRTAANTIQNFVGQQLNTGFNQAVGQYNTDFDQRLAATKTNNDARGQNVSQALSLSQLIANLGKQKQDQQIASGKAQLDFGNTVMAQEQAQKDNAYEKGYLQKRDYPMDIYERLAAINAMQPVNRTSTTTGTEKSSGGWLGPLLGAGAQIIAASDERAKENIEDVDPEEILGAFASVTPKRYTYKQNIREALPDLTSDGVRTGFMAQDLERAFGKPSGPTVKGVKTVDMVEVMGNLVAAVHGLEKRTRGLSGTRRGDPAFSSKGGRS